MSNSFNLEAVPASTRYNYQGRCWWCGDDANSREHKWKKSELNALYGGDISKNYPLTWMDDAGNSKQVQGPNSVAVKFEASLCQNCNNARSQPFDRAYDQWIGYVSENYDQIIQRSYIDLREIVDPAEVEGFRLGLARYFVKHVCCRVADKSAGKVPEKALSFLNGETIDSTDFIFTELCLNEAALENQPHSRNMLGMSQTIGSYLEEGSALLSLKGALIHRALQLVWDINLDPNNESKGNGVLNTYVHPLRVVSSNLLEHRFIYPCGPNDSLFTAY